jgi:6,7-dimethyl-8-ribityllumazine synthase
MAKKAEGVGPSDKSSKAKKSGLKIVIVASQFNRSITEALLEGALESLTDGGILKQNIGIYWVPGAFELPVTAAQAAVVARPDAIVAVGCIIKGQTPQYTAIGQAVAIGLAQVSVQHRVPVGFGVIVADELEQAKNRAGGDWGNRGSEAAVSVLKTLESFGKMTEIPPGFKTRK